MNYHSEKHDEQYPRVVSMNCYNGEYDGRNPGAVSMNYGSASRVDSLSALCQYELTHVSNMDSNPALLV
jgi:hypothetical protein